MKKRTLATFMVAAGASMILPVAVTASHGTTQNSTTNSQSQVKAAEVETEKSEAAEHSQAPANASVTGVANASDNSVLSDTTTPTTTTAPTTTITKDEATKIAMAQHAGVAVKETEQDNEEGMTAFEVEFVDGSKIVVGSDGTILSKKIVTAPATTNNQGTNNTNNSNNSHNNSGHGEGNETETHGNHGQN